MEQSILTTPTAFAAAVTAVTSQVVEPSATPTDMQSMTNAAVAAVARNTNNAYKIPPTDGWSY